jgi:hypothetical protein
VPCSGSLAHQHRVVPTQRKLHAIGALPRGFATTRLQHKPGRDQPRGQ